MTDSTSRATCVDFTTKLEAEFKEFMNEQIDADVNGTPIRRGSTINDTMRVGLEFGWMARAAWAAKQSIPSQSAQAEAVAWMDGDWVQTEKPVDACSGGKWTPLYANPTPEPEVACVMIERGLGLDLRHEPAKILATAIDHKNSITVVIAPAAREAALEKALRAMLAERSGAAQLSDACFAARAALGEG